jgi:hypothetical protein
MTIKQSTLKIKRQQQNLELREGTMDEFSQNIVRWERRSTTDGALPGHEANQSRVLVLVFCFCCVSEPLFFFVVCGMWIETVYRAEPW